MSKRKHQTSIKEFREQGYLPEAMNNFLALLGWSVPGSDRELFSMGELIGAFSLEHIHKGGAVFNEEKLRWFNREYLLAMPTGEFEFTALQKLKEALAGRVVWKQEVGQALLPLLRERVQVWSDIRAQAESDEFDYFFTRPEPEPARIPEKKSTAAAAREHLEAVIRMLENISETNFTPEGLREALWPYAEEQGRGAVLWPMRYALSGRERSPDPFVLASILGKNEALERLHQARAIIE